MRVLLCLCLCFFALSGQTETLELEYSSFYAHIKKLSSADQQALQFAFGFKQVGSSALCQLQRVYIHTQKVDIPVTVSAQQRFVLPDEKTLKMAHAMVMVELPEAANRCDMSVQLETKAEYLKTSYSHQELSLLLGQYQSFFDDMGGFLSFLMPSVNGLLIEFSQSQDSPLPSDHIGLWVDGKLLLNLGFIMKGDGLELPSMPLRITPWTEKLPN
jgi:hypothetical protein